MRAFLGTVLSVIAVGVLLIAYGLLSPRAAAAPFSVPAADPYYAPARAVPASDIVTLGQPSPYDASVTSRHPLVYPVNEVQTIRTVQSSAPVRRASTTSVARANGRNWQKTALVIGGTTAAGAGLGAIFGGGKGALIGAAIGGGASTLYEATKR